VGVRPSDPGSHGPQIADFRTDGTSRGDLYCSRKAVAGSISIAEGVANKRLTEACTECSHAKGLSPSSQSPRAERIGLSPLPDGVVAIGFPIHSGRSPTWRRFGTNRAFALHSAASLRPVVLQVSNPCHSASSPQGNKRPYLRWMQVRAISYSRVAAKAVGLTGSHPSSLNDQVHRRLLLIA
jgi:hypothetical protein